MNNIIKLRSYHVDKIWGYEKWILSTHKNGVSFIEGEDKDLFEYLGKEIPILIKEINTMDTLSVQVHPSDDYASKYENDRGKTECWYILEAQDDSSLICGMDSKVTKDEFLEIVNGGSFEKFLKKIRVKAGDMIYIPSGVVHAIGVGIRLLEIQQCSDITYRIYDWGRDRELHINKALDVIKFNQEDYGGKINNFKVLKTPYFTVERIKVVNKLYCITKNGFNIYFCTEGYGTVFCGNQNKIHIFKNEAIYIDDFTQCTICGNLDLLKIY